MTKDGHRPNKQLVSIEEMRNRLKTAINPKVDDSFIMAKTDAIASEGIDGAIKRCKSYIEEGADGIFLEAVTSIEQYKGAQKSLFSSSF